MTTTFMAMLEGLPSIAEQQAIVAHNRPILQTIHDAHAIAIRSLRNRPDLIAMSRAVYDEAHDRAANFVRLEDGSY